MKRALVVVVMVVLLMPAGAAAASSHVHEARFRSAALARTGSFELYLPPDYGRSRHRFPTLYLLHGSNSRASSFLDFGLQRDLDHLIARRRVPPMIVVMIQGGPGENDWLDTAAGHYASYVLETQALVDRVYRTLPTRIYRAIGGYSMGGFGAVNIALEHLDRFSVVESWSGFFDGLTPAVSSDRALFARLPLRAFFYGGDHDRTVSASENEPFAAELRGVGVRAGAAVYPGAHNSQLWSAHLSQMLAIVGRAFRGRR